MLEPEKITCFGRLLVHSANLYSGMMFSPGRAGRHELTHDLLPTHAVPGVAIVQPRGGLGVTRREAPASEGGAVGNCRLRLVPSVEHLCVKELRPCTEKQPARDGNQRKREMFGQTLCGTMRGKHAEYVNMSSFQSWKHFRKQR